MVRKYAKWIPVVLTLVWCLVIWNFSLAPGKTSANTSGEVVDFVNGVLEDAGIDAEVTGKTVRKTAHFSEFLLLGALASLSFWAQGFRHWHWLSGFVTVPAAVIDECIQIFVPDRGPHILDVLLDVAGGAFGAILFFAFWYLAASLKKKSTNRQKNSKNP